MLIDSQKMISVSEINRNFSSATKLLEREGSIVVMKNNKPKYLMINLDNAPQIDMNDDEKLLFVANRLIKKYKKGFLRLAE